MIVIRVALIGIVGVILANYFKNVKSEYSLLIGLAISILIFYYIITKLAGLIEIFSGASEIFAETYDFMEVLIKMLGISYVCELSAGICKDAGCQSIAVQIVILGKIVIMTLGASIIFSLIELINMYLV